MGQYQGDSVEAGEKRRVGLPLRILRFPLTAMIIGFLLVGFGYGLSQGVLIYTRRTFGVSPLMPLFMVFGAALVLVLYYVQHRWIEASPPDDLRGPGIGREVSLGLFWGFALFSLATGSVALLGGYRIVGLRDGIGNLWAILALSIISGIAEEALFRGVVLRLMEKMIGTGAALALTSLFFGYMHIRNPGASMFSSLAIALEAGILFGAAYLYTRRIWMAAGMHGAWNFTQGWIYSIPISGTTHSNGMVVAVRAGPDWLTGGSFGLEASVCAMVVATIAGLAFLLAAYRKGRFRPPMWQRQTKL